MSRFSGLVLKLNLISQPNPVRSSQNFQKKTCDCSKNITIGLSDVKNPYLNPEFVVEALLELIIQLKTTFKAENDI